MGRTHKRILISSLVFLLIIGIGLAFWSFSVGNRNRIMFQNEEYLAELTSQRASSINSMMDENVHFIQVTANLYGESLSSPEADVSLIRRYEDSTAFEMLRFIDMNGDNYTSQGVAANLSDRDYFQAGTRGESGVTYVSQSRVTGQKQIGFYAPVYYGGEIVGVMVGFYGEDYIQRMLGYRLFGYDGEGWLCMSDGTVIGSTFEKDPENFLEFLTSAQRCTEGEAATIAQALSEANSVSFTYFENGQVATAYIEPLLEDGWMLIRSFPPAASAGILSKANREGSKLLLTLIALFALFISALVVFFLTERRRAKAANKKANDISVGVVNIFEKFAVLDLVSEEWVYIEGTPDDKQLPNAGKFEEFYTSFLSRVPDEGQKKEVEAFIQPRHLANALKSTNTASIRVHAPYKGADLWYTYNFIVIERDEEKNPLRLLVVRQDATSLHDKEEQDRRKLRDALDAAERASQAKTEFLFNMSHDIRTPMNAIMGYTDIARAHSDDKKLVDDSLSKIKTSSEHLLSLINDVLDMSRIESGKLELHDEDFSIVESVQKLQDIIRPQAARKNQTVNLYISIEHPMIHADPLRLNQVLINILSNAVKYTKDGGHIELFADELACDEPNKALYQFRIKDNGIGMSEEYLPHLFENFSREYNSTISRVQGTGLGMAIAKQLVDRMGGTINVVSKLNEGSEFTVFIPAPYLELEASASPVLEAQYSPEDMKGLRILLAEDNMINAEIAKMMLSEGGFEVVHVENGKLAVEVFEADTDGFDAVLMDVQMPVMDGYEATRGIRQFEAARNRLPIPIIAMTANTFADDKKNALDAGMNAHIGKPYQQDEMIRTVAAYAMQHHFAKQPIK